MVIIAKIDKEKELVKLMQSLSISREEAEEIFASDRAIEREEAQDFDLPPAKQAIAQKYAYTGTRQAKQETVYQFEQKKPRKTDATKEGIIAELADLLTNKSAFDTSDVTVTNAGREIELKICGKWYSVTLKYCRNKNKAEGIK